MADDLDIIFKGGEKVIAAVAKGDVLVDPLAMPSDACKLIGTKIKLGKKIGSGQFGKVFIITVEGKGNRKYVVKRSQADIAPVWDIPATVVIKTHRLIPREILQAFNPKVDFNEKSQRVSMIVPTFAYSCRTDRELQPKANPPLPGGGNLRIPKGSYLCENPMFSEFYIGTLVGNAYRDGKCINFFDVYSLITCGRKKEYYNYMFMDKIDGEFRENATCVKASIYARAVPKKHVFDVHNGIFIQLMFAIAFYQDKWMISHNDLHSSNIFVEYVTDETEFNGKKLIEAEWYHYHISSKDGNPKCDIYFRAIPAITKIGDYGLAVKYSPPIVGDRRVFADGYMQRDGTGPWIPNQFFPAYDSLFAGHDYDVKVQKDATQDERDPVLDSMVEFLAGGIKFRDIENSKLGVLRTGIARPVLDKLSGLPGAIDLLRSDLVQKLYGKKPSSGKIVTLGVL